MASSLYTRIEQLTDRIPGYVSQLLILGLIYYIRQIDFVKNEMNLLILRYLGVGLVVMVLAIFDGLET